MSKMMKNRVNNNCWDCLLGYFSILAGVMMEAKTLTKSKRDDGKQHYEFRGSLKSCLDHLSSKRVAFRKAALEGIVSSLEGSVELQFVEKNYYTLLYECRTFIKRGSKEEATLAARIIGLLAMVMSCSGLNCAHEIYEESITLLSEALFSKSSKLDTVELLNCLAIVTFFCAEHEEETQDSMQIIWEFLDQESSSDADELANAQTVATAMTAWSFLLATCDGPLVSRSLWQGGLSFALDMLMSTNEECVQVSACVALCLMLELDCLKKFMDEDEISGGVLVDERAEELKEHIWNHVDGMILEANAKRQRQHPNTLVKNRVIWDPKPLIKDICDHVLHFIEEGHLSVEVEVNKSMETVSTWSQMIQLAFMKNFLRHGFDKQMLGNPFLRYVFMFTQAKELESEMDPIAALNTVPLLEDGYYAPDEVKVHYLIPYVDEIHSTSDKIKKKFFKSSNSAYSKGMTRLLNKKRMVSLQEKMRLYEDEGCHVDILA